jgi:ribosomal protein S18 acetylase RimI-like enzyme
MLIQPRAYGDEQDLAAMCAILLAGQQAGTPTHYEHVGDLYWSLFYLNLEDDRRQTIYLWETAEDAAAPKTVVGWTHFAPGFAAFDVYVHPALRSSAEAAQIWIWAEEQMASGMRAQGEPQIGVFGVAEQDAWLHAHLTGRGFVRSPFTLVHLECPLVGELPAPCLPAGYRVRAVAGTHEAQQRAAPSHAAFGSQTAFARYWPRYLTFMRSPVYTPALDLVVEAPDGRFVAFCTCWLDATSQVGHFEPVGVQPDFQRRGLGRAVMQAGLRLLQAHGMTTATVSTELGEPAANRLYAAVGFHAAYQLYTYKKAL